MSLFRLVFSCIKGLVLQYNNFLSYIQNNRWKTGICVFLILFVIRNVFWGDYLPQATCADGWGSPSIGNRGACSHHGGVHHPPAHWSFYLIAGVAVFVAMLPHSYLKVIGFFTKKGKANLDTRPISPYGSKKKHREILISSGANENAVEEVLVQYRDDDV